MQVDTSAGPIEVSEAGDGPAVVLLHGLFADEQLWAEVVPGLVERGMRVITPTLPLGSHRLPMRPGADLSPPGLAALIAELVGALGTEPVTVVANDTATALTQLLLADHPGVASRAVLTSGDCYDYFFPPVFRPLTVLPRVPGGLRAMGRAVRIRAVRDSPLAYGWLTRRGISEDLARRWSAPVLSDPGVRRDTAAVLRGVDRSITEDVVHRFPTIRVPVLVAWGDDDRAFPLRLARRLVSDLPDARLAVVPDSACYVPLDAPDQLAKLIGDFVPA